MLHWVDYSGCWIQRVSVYDYDNDEFEFLDSLSTLDECKAACANNYTCVAVGWEDYAVDDIKYCTLMYTAPSAPSNTTDYEVIIDYYELRRICPQS